VQKTHDLSLRVSRQGRIKCKTRSNINHASSAHRRKPLRSCFLFVSYIILKCRNNNNNNNNNTLHSLVIEILSTIISSLCSDNLLLLLSSFFQIYVIICFPTFLEDVSPCTYLIIYYDRRRRDEFSFVSCFYHIAADCSCITNYLFNTIVHSPFQRSLNMHNNILIVCDSTNQPGNYLYKKYLT